ncbi:hypothetical protein LABALGNA3A7_09830 [Dellaglioa algida]|nr:hypothetical protein LABALGNA3A7_09830 [Dellaglioa algida]
MIKLFSKNESNFDTNGIGVLDSAIRESSVEEKLNGLYELSFAYLTSGNYAKIIDGDMIIKAPTPDGEQLFRIVKIVKNVGYLEVSCYHIFYDLAGNFIEDTNIVDQDGQNAISHIGNGLQYATKFKFISNITKSASARMVRLNAVQALLDTSQDNSFLSRFGGEIKRDNFNVYINDIRGNDKGFKIRHGKNLTGYEADIDYSTVVTSIMPYGYNGLMLPEKYIMSPLANKYAFVRIKKIEYTDIKAIEPDATSEDEDAVPLEKAYELLRAAAKNEYAENEIDIPSSNFKVTFKNLVNTKEYADFKALEKIEPWDYVTVIAEGLDIKSRMISYKFNPMTSEYSEIELGNYVPSFTDIGGKVDHATDLANEANENANKAVTNANGKNSNYYGPDKPSNPVDGDLWYKKNGDKTELWQYDGKSIPPDWVLLVDDYTGEEIKKKVDEAQKDADKAKEDAQSAVDEANEAVKNAGFANKTAEEAKTSAATAGEEAIKAGKDAKTALDNFENMDLGSRNYLRNANFNEGLTKWRLWGVDKEGSSRELVDINWLPNVTKGLHILHNQTGEFGYAQDSIPILPNKEYTVSYFYKTKSKSKITIQIGNGNGSGSSDLFKYFEIMTDGSDTAQRITTTFKTSANATKTNFYIGSKTNGIFDLELTAPQLETGNKVSDFEPNPEDLQIAVTNIDGELASKVSQTAFDTLNKTVTTQGTAITQNKKDISFKANQTDVNTLTGRVTTAEGKLIVQAGQISQTVSKNELTNTLGSYATQTWTQGQIKTTADNIQLSVSKVQTNLDNLAVGSRNYILLSNIPATGNGTAGANEIIGRYFFSYGQNVNSTLKEGDSFFIAVDYTCIGSGTGGTGTIQFNGAPWQASPAKPLSEKGTLILTGKWSDKWNIATVDGIQVRFDNVAKTRKITVNHARFFFSSKDSGWTLAPEDTATQADYAAVEIKVNGIQSTVQNKADKSQVTQLADQITSIVTDGLTGAQRNLVANSEFSDGNGGGSLAEWSQLGNPPNNTWYASNGGNLKGSATVTFMRTGVNGVVWQEFVNRTLAVSSVKHYSASVWINLYADQTPTNIQFAIEYLDAKGNRQEMFVVNPDLTKRNIWQQLKLNDKQPIKSTSTHVRIIFVSGGNGHVAWSKPMFVNDTTVGNYAPNDVSTSQITQLKNDINLRVQKGDVLNQINISTEGILIDGRKVHITGQTSIDNAVIKDAMIATIKADKITAGTINAANINLINLNANNIASGTISGINISGVTFRGTDMHLENGLTIGTNGGIFSDFDYGETIGQAFDPRWWKGDVKFTKNYLGYYAQEYVGAAGGKPGTYLGSVQTYIGPNYFKIRKYTNNTNSDMIGRVDMKAEYIQIATGASKQANGVMIYAGGDIDASGTINASQGMYAGRFRLGTKGHTFGTNDDGEVYFLKKDESPLGIHAAAFHQGSLRSIKKNFEATQSKDSLELLDGMNIQKWNYKGESDLKKKHIGLVIDDSTEVRSLKNKLETPGPVLSDDNKSVDLNNFVGLLVSAVQELSKEVKKLKKMEEVNTNEN